MDFDPKSGVADKSSVHFNPITIIAPTKVSSPHIMPLVQNTEVTTFSRPILSSGASLPAFVTTSAKILPIAIPVDAVSHAPNLLTSLRPLKGEPGRNSSLSSVQTSNADQSMFEPITTSPTAFLKASSLVSFSAVPTVSIEANQPASLISVVPVDITKSAQSAPSVAATIRSAPRIPIAVAPNRSIAAGLTLSRPSIGRQLIITPVPPRNSACPLTPNRKRARKQQLLGPQGTKSPSAVKATSASSVVTNIVEIVTPQNDSGVVKSLLQKVNSSTINSPVATTITCTPNIEAALLRTAAKTSQSGKDVSHFERVNFSANNPTMTPQLHSLVVSSSSNTGLEELQPAVTSPLVSTTASIAASLVTASSFHSGGLASQHSMYIFPNAAVATPNAATSVGNVLQVRFRTPTPTKPPPASNTTVHQAVRTILSQQVTNNAIFSGIHMALQPSLAPASPTLRKASAVDWSNSKSSSSVNQALPLSLTSGTAEENIRQIPSASNNATAKANSMDTSGQPTMPILRVLDPNSRNCFENLNTATATIASSCKRQRNQSSSASGIKKQCTWELRTDPKDSNKSVWRSPLERKDEQSMSRSSQESELFGASTKRKADLDDTTDSVLYGCPLRMRLYKSSHQPSRFNGLWKGPKSGHFLRSSEIRQRPGDALSSSTVNGNSFEPELRHRRPRHQVQHEHLEISEIGNPFNNSDFFTLSELLELRNQQAETGFVNYPVDVTSPLDLNCGRIILCLKNCDKLVGIEYEKLSTLSRAFERKQCECCSSQNERGKGASSMLHFINHQQQELITRLFLQAIPPASPPLSDSLTGRQEDRRDEETIQDKLVQSAKTDADLKIIEERTLDLLQRMRALMNGLRRVSKLSSDLIAGHRETVISFVDDLEFLQQNGSARSSTTSSTRSPQHLRDKGSSSSTSTDIAENEISETRVQPRPVGSASSLRGTLPSVATGGVRQRSASPTTLRGSSSARINFHNDRRR